MQLLMGWLAALSQQLWSFSRRSIAIDDDDIKSTPLCSELHHGTVSGGGIIGIPNSLSLPLCPSLSFFLLWLRPSNKKNKRKKKIFISFHSALTHEEKHCLKVTSSFIFLASKRGRVVEHSEGGIK